MGKYRMSDIFEGDYKVSQKYGVNPQYYNQFGLSGHEGVDWATPSGVWLIIPFEKGQVLRTGYDPKYGYYIVTWDSIQRCAVWYCHMSALNVSPGQILPRKTRVGKTGNTGNSTGPHLHCNFAETDQYANRLNTGNGYRGFLNILDTALVEWQLDTHPQPNADEYVNIAKAATQTLVNAINTGLQVGDPSYKTKMAQVKSRLQEVIAKL